MEKNNFRKLTVCFKEGLTIKIALETLHGGQFTLSTQLIQPKYLVICPTYAAPQFLWKFTPFIHLSDDETNNTTKTLNPLSPKI